MSEIKIATCDKILWELQKFYKWFELNQDFVLKFYLKHLIKVEMGPDLTRPELTFDQQ